MELRPRRALGARRRRVLRQRDQRDARRRVGLVVHAHPRRREVPRRVLGARGTQAAAPTATAPLAGRVAFVTGGRRASGARSPSASREGACVVVADLDGERRREGRCHDRRRARAGGRGRRQRRGRGRGAFADAALRFGGVDLVVNNAGFARSAALVDTTVDDWDRLHAVLARGSFLVSREAARMMASAGIGGDIVYVVSKNASPPGRQRRLRRGQGRPGAPGPPARGRARAHGIRVNGVNPDGVVEGSGIFNSAWREARAAAHGVEPDRSASSTRAAPCSAGGAAAPCRRRRRRAHRRRPLPDHRPDRAGRRRRCGRVPAMNGDCDDDADHRGADRRGRGGPASPPTNATSTCCASASPTRGIDADAVIDEVARFSVAAPSWAVGTGGTRFGRFPIGGEPRTTEEKIDDIAALNALTGANRTVSLHVPWDDPAIRRTPGARRRRRHRLRRDELEHVPGQPVHHRRRRGVLQVRFARPRRPRRAQARARAQPGGHRARRAARFDRAHGLARRRHEPSRARPTSAASSNASPKACASYTTRCRTTGRCTSSTSRTSPRSTRA